MSEEFRVEINYKDEMTEASVSNGEIELLESLLPELVQLALRFDDSEDD